MKLNRKNKLLIFGFLLTLYICYAFAISKTITYYKVYYSKKEIIENAINSPELLSQLKGKEKQMDLFLAKNKIADTESLQNDLLKQLSFYANSYHLKIVDFKEPHKITENNSTVTSYIFSLQGTYNSCLALINKIENENKLGFVKHLNFEKKKNFKTNTDELFVEVILQN